MREWNLKSGDPLSLTLAADARLGHTDYCNDQIWEISLREGEPPSLGLQTTYGLRARNMRIFPRFTLGEITLSDPAEFAIPPSVLHFSPNYLTLSFAPFETIRVRAEYWVPTSQSVTGRFEFTNLDSTTQLFILEWAAVLSPDSPEGQRMAAVEMGVTTVLAGRTADLTPVFFLTGGTQASVGPYPSLTVNLELEPQGPRQITWAHAALSTPEASFELARSTVARNWEAEQARIDLLNSGLVEIHTGDSDWDSAFAFSQKTALGLFQSPTDQLAHTSFVLSRQPDQGYSFRSDGSDYTQLWSGQSALEALFLSSLILPASPSLAKDILLNYLDTQTEDGFVDWKPGLGGQRSQLLATPLLANLAWQIYQATTDESFLVEVFPKLLAFVHAWFSPDQDRDGDGIPEWSHSMQSGFEDHPLFAYWHDWSRSIDITTTETPSLCAFLYRECQTLIRMANLLNRPEITPSLLALMDNLRLAVEISWDKSSWMYHYWDRDSHYSPNEELLGERLGSGDLLVQRSFDQPVRLLIRIQSNSDTPHRPVLFVHGTSPGGQHLVERIEWFLGMSFATGERIYSQLERVEIHGLEELDRISIHIVGYNCLDQTLLLPLWAGVPVQERASAIVEKSITNPEKFWRDYGIPACAYYPSQTDIPNCHYVHIPWNYLIGEGLLAYGYRKESAELTSKIMAAVIRSLNQNRAFSRYYHADTGQGLGDKNALEGLAPLGLFLDTLGVRLISPRKVELDGINPFPWPVTVKYRGLTIFRRSDKTTVVFQDGQTITVTDPSPQIVSLE
jgi:hypothetical protein